MDLDKDSLLFHSALRQARTELGLTQKDFAESVDIGVNSLQRYEMPRGKEYASRPNPSTLKRINDFIRKEFDAKNENTLERFTIEQLVGEIKRRGFALTLT